MLGFGKESPPLQAYGKLPLAKDYLRVGAGDGLARDVREWLDHAFSGRPGEEAPQLLWPARFVIAGDRDALLGTAWPSSDAGGLRRFPFALFVERRRKALIESLARDLGLEQPWWERVEAFHSARENFGDGQSFLAALRGQSVAVEKAEAPGAEADHVDWDAWLGALWPADRETALFDSLRAIAQLARNRHPSPLRLPLVRDLPILEQVATWCRALIDLEWIERGTLPSLWFPREADPAAGASARFLVASRRPLAPNAVDWLSRAPGASPLDAGDLDDAKEHAAGAAAPARGAALADSMRGALATFRARQ